MPADHDAAQPRAGDSTVPTPVDPRAASPFAHKLLLLETSGVPAVALRWRRWLSMRVQVGHDASDFAAVSSAAAALHDARDDDAQGARDERSHTRLCRPSWSHGELPEARDAAFVLRSERGTEIVALGNV